MLRHLYCGTGPKLVVDAERGAILLRVNALPKDAMGQLTKSLVSAGRRRVVCGTFGAINQAKGACPDVADKRCEQEVPHRPNRIAHWSPWSN
jgi:hypothetical protein